MPAYPTAMKPQTRPRLSGGSLSGYPRLHNPANINSPPGKYRPPKQRPGYKKTPAWKPVKYRPPVKNPLVKLPFDPWKQTPLPAPGLSPGQQMKIARMSYTLFKYGRTHPALTTAQLLAQLYGELYQNPQRTPRWWYYPIAASGYTYCWGQQPNCGHTITDAMSVGGGSVCITNLACATNQVYSDPQTQQMLNGEPLTGLGRRLLFGKSTNPALLRFTLHEAWHYPNVNVPAAIAPLGARAYGYPLPVWFDDLPKPKPDVGYRVPPDSDAPAAPPRPKNAPGMHQGKPPGPRTKEGKRTGNFGSGLADATGMLAGETGDIIGALYKALPWKYQNWRDDRTIQSKAMKLWRLWRHVDIGKAIKNIAGNQLEDMALGKFGSVGKAAVKKAAKGGYWTGERGFSSGTGFRDF